MVTRGNTDNLRTLNDLAAPPGGLLVFRGKHRGGDSPNPQFVRNPQSKCSHHVRTRVVDTPILGMSIAKPNPWVRVVSTVEELRVTGEPSNPPTWASTGGERKTLPVVPK